MDNNKQDVSVTEVGSYGEERAWTVEDEKRIRRTMDLRLMPMVFVLYLAMFIDRANIGNARILGMAKDLDLIGYRFNIILTLFYIAFMLIAIPSNVGVRAVGGRYWLSGMVTSFGLVTMCTAFLRTYKSMLGLRFLLGIFEGGVLPGFSFYLSLFYRRHELAFRVASFMCGASLAGAFGGLLAAGLSQIPTWGTPALRIDTWRNIFLLEGLMTVLLGSIAFFVLPTRPLEFQPLSMHDRHVAGGRIEQENRESSVEKIRLHHVVRGIFNINNTICGLGLCGASICVTSLSVFVPTILHDFGWTSVRANLMSVPPYAVAATFTITVSIWSDKVKKRGVFAVCCSAISAIGYAILVSPVSDKIKYMAVFFACCGVFALGPIYICWTLNNAAGPTIRAVSVAYMSLWGHVGTLIAIWSYLPSGAPRFIQGHSISLGACCVNILVALFGITYCRWENSLRERGARDYRLEGLTQEQEWRLGYRHPRMRYTL